MNDPLQFDHAELANPSACGACKSALGPSYFQAAGQMLCGNCAEGFRKALAGNGSRGGRVVKATLLGLLAGAVGAAIYYGVLALTGYNVGLVAIVVGMLVGRAVRRGSGNRGGLGYQFLAAGITYFAIAATYVPTALKEIAETSGSGQVEAVSGTTEGITTDGKAAKAPATQPEAATAETNKTVPTGEEEISPVLAIIALVGLTLALPILAAFGGGVISLLIVGFGVWEAWRLNKRIKIDITGPHELASQPPSLPAAHG
ncbi:hypothetical protein [Luteolibacter soli]|uniref:DUF4190 domain-containing protein n=1 Tax=Luteolibacter soli TaxID=3135280 RepID=A0ABU9AWN8_9BACT